jgi:hypothetical protein
MEWVFFIAEWCGGVGRGATGVAGRTGMEVLYVVKWDLDYKKRSVGFPFAMRYGGLPSATSIVRYVTC